MEFSLKDLKELLGVKNDLPFEIGDNVFIRTVTYHITGKVTEIKGKFVKLEKAAWIADSGRFSDALKKEEFSEVEPFVNAVWINTDSIADFTFITRLPDAQK
ncbi:MAG: hypothetical protein HGB12_00120 [Bacteroidetes bacterium]|nr:hypothetical protein [Bacteroidota bacterium]